MADETKQDEAPDALRGFLARLATDPAELGRFVKDPHAAMEAAKLSPGDRAILQSGNPAAIHARLQAGTGSTMPVISLVVDASGDKDPTLTVRGAGGFGGILQLPQVVPQIVLPQIGPP